MRAGADIGVERFTTDDYEGAVRPPHTDVEGGVYGDVVWQQFCAAMWKLSGGNARTTAASCNR